VASFISGGDFRFDAFEPLWIERARQLQRLFAAGVTGLAVNAGGLDSMAGACAQAELGTQIFVVCWR